MITAATTLTRSERTPITHRLGYLPPYVFTADVVLDGQDYEYVFWGDRNDPDAVALGRIRSHGTNDYRAVLADGRVVAEHVTRRTALRAITTHAAA